MKEDEITQDMFKHHDNAYINNEYSLCMSGTYRRIVAMAEIHNYEVIKYKDPLSDLITPFYMEGDKSNIEKEGMYEMKIRNSRHT